MHTIVSTLLMLLLNGSAPLLAQTDEKQQLVVPLSDPGKPGSLEVGLLNGSIHVVGYNGKEVIIEASTGTTHSDRVKEKEKIKERVSDERASSTGMKRISTGGSLDLSAQERNNQVRVEANSHRYPVDLTIRVPQRFSVKVSTVNRGTITVRDITGDLELNNVNGSIELTNISGSAVANTVNGHLTAVFRDTNGNKPMAFSTLNGRIDVTFPASVKANVKMKSDRGDIYSDFDVDIEKNQPQVNRSSQSGMYRVSIEDWVNGRINGGGPEVMMKSMQGSIYVRKAK